MVTTLNGNFPPPPAQTATATSPALAFEEITTGDAHRAVIYGPGGIGKTTLGCMAPGPVAFIDLDDSLGRLRSQLETQGLLDGVRRVPGVENWQGLRDTVNAVGWDDYRTIVIDSLTKAEEMAVAHTLEYVPHEKGYKIASIEDYGYGSGLTHVFETFLPLLADLDRHCRQGRNVVLVCHECTNTVPNPAGEDWLRYEPRLQSPKSGKSSIRLRVKEWADHVLFYGYDVVAKDGKASGSGSRTLYPSERPECMAKSRVHLNPITDPNECWPTLFR